jgi:hypothetical protein
MRIFRDPADLARAIEGATRRRYTVGIDLGASRDPTAVTVLETVETPIVHLNAPVPEEVPLDIRYDLVHAERLPLGMDYSQIVADLVRIVNRSPIKGAADIGYDFSGVGRPVGSMLKESGIKRLVPIQITGGTSFTKESDGTYNVSKVFLMSSLLRTIHTKALHISPDLDYFEALRQELQDLREHTSASGNIRVEALEGRKDDLALALAVAVFVTTHRPKPAAISRYILGG